MNVAEKSTQMSEGKNIASALSSSGRIFRGTITKIFGQRAVIEFERTVKIQKYERFAKKKTRLHARIPEGTDVKIGDVVKVRECRPLSKIIHFVVTDVLSGKGEGK